jgi:diguanylate cyclase (GGDEF)-like protein/PAS domain S-box-containing protein
MLVTDESGTILRVNHAFTKITGYTAEEAIGKNPRLLKSNAHDATFYADMWQRIANTGTFEGEVLNRRKNGEVYTEQLTISAVKDNVGNITHYVGAFIDISVRKENEARLGFLANHDRLTELPNRELFYDRLSQAISQARRKNEGVALLFLDLDGFKPVNDAYGHEAGDVVLKVVAKRVQACVRSMDTVARMGGDEFAVILSSLHDSLDAEIVAKKIIRNIGEIIQLNAATTCVIGISIGIAIYPDNGTEIDMLMNAADSAMYDSKAAGKNTYTLSTLQSQVALNAPWINEDEIQKLGVQII